MRRSKPNQIMLWPSNRNKGDDPDGNNSDLKFNSPIHHADFSEVFFILRFFEIVKNAKLKFYPIVKEGFVRNGSRWVEKHMVHT